MYMGHELTRADKRFPLVVGNAAIALLRVVICAAIVDKSASTFETAAREAVTKDKRTPKDNARVILCSWVVDCSWSSSYTHSPFYTFWQIYQELVILRNLFCQ